LITFIHEVLPNMVTWHEVWEHYVAFDKRICPWECYVEEEVRPYFPETMLRFRLKDSNNVPDTTHEFGGVAGGQTPQGYVLPPIVFPKPSVNTTSPSDPKVQGSATGPVGDSDSSSDSWEEEDLADVDLSEDERLQRMMVADAHKLHKLRQAVVKGLGITIEIHGDYVYQGVLHEVIFSRETKFSEPPSHLLEPYQLAYKEIERIGVHSQGGFPASCIWAALGVPRGDVDIGVFKIGQGVFIRYAHAHSEALDMRNLPEQIRADLPLDWAVMFGTSENPVDLELTERMMNITSQLDPTGKQYIRPWQVHLLKLPIRSGELGTPAARVCKVAGQWDDYRRIDRKSVV
jgi:hypothetical protein